MALGKYTKTPDERKRYTVDYSDWLDTGELVTAITYEVTFADDSAMTGTPLVVDEDSINVAVTGSIFFVSGGDDGYQYKVIAEMTTSGGQIREDSILYNVKAP